MAARGLAHAAAAVVVMVLRLLPNGEIGAIQAKVIQAQDMAGPVMAQAAAVEHQEAGHIGIMMDMEVQVRPASP